MKGFAFLAALLVVFVVATGAIVAGDKDASVTLEGKVVCAKCGLQEAGREECQNVLVVKSGDSPEHYYLTKNAVDEEFGPVCMKTKAVQVTGTVSEKDGKMWLAATKIVPSKSEG